MDKEVEVEYDQIVALFSAINSIAKTDGEVKVPYAYSWHIMKRLKEFRAKYIG